MKRLYVSLFFEASVEIKRKWKKLMCNENFYSFSQYAYFPYGGTVCVLFEHQITFDVQRRGGVTGGVCFTSFFSFF